MLLLDTSYILAEISWCPTPLSPFPTYLKDGHQALLPTPYLARLYVRCSIAFTNLPQPAFRTRLGDGVSEVRFEWVTAGKKAEKPVGREGVARANPPAVEQLARDEQDSGSSALIGLLEFSLTPTGGNVLRFARETKYGLDRCS